MSIRKVNLSDLQGQLSKRGRERFVNPELTEAFTALIKDGEPFCWEDAVVTGNDKKQVTASKAKWRNRAVSVFTALPDKVRKGKNISITWTLGNEMVISIKE